MGCNSYSSIYSLCRLKRNHVASAPSFEILCYHCLCIGWQAKIRGRGEHGPIFTERIVVFCLRSCFLTSAIYCSQQDYASIVTGIAVFVAIRLSSFGQWGVLFTFTQCSASDVKLHLRTEFCCYFYNWESVRVSIKSKKLGPWISCWCTNYYF